MSRVRMCCWQPAPLTSSPVCLVVMMEETEELSPLRVASTVQALSSALRGNREHAPAANRGKGDRVFPDPEKLWFKESSAKNLRNRDFLSPTTVLNTLYADGQVSLTFFFHDTRFSVTTVKTFFCVFYFKILIRIDSNLTEWRAFLYRMDSQSLFVFINKVILEKLSCFLNKLYCTFFNLQIHSQ